MSELVDAVLHAEAEKEAKYKPTDVQKVIDVEIDEGHLLTCDVNPVDCKNIRSAADVYLKELARDNVQLLVNRIWQLPVEKADDAVIAALPDPTTVLPREKPIPKPRPLTRWQQYAKQKGIKTRKKGRMVWDDRQRDWKPRWGYKRANDDTKDWLMEVPDHANPYEDQFAKSMKEKKERTAKNELQRLRNIARISKGRVPSIGITPSEEPGKEQVEKAIHAARKSTASVGVFTDKLPKEKTKGKHIGKKRKFEPNFGNMPAEKKRALDILRKVQSKNPIVDATKAANQQLLSEERQKRSEKKTGGNRKKNGVKANKRKGGNAGGKRGKRKGK